MQKKRKKSLTLLEILLALGIASILLGMLFPSLIETIRLRKKIETEKKLIYSKAYVQQRLSSLFACLSTSDPFYIVEKKRLQFALFEDDFDGKVDSSLFLENGMLLIEMKKEDHVKKEPLLNNIKAVRFSCFDIEKNKLCEKNEERESDPLPAFFVLHVIFNNDKSDSFYFRLQANHHWELKS